MVYVKVENSIVVERLNYPENFPPTGDEYFRTDEAQVGWKYSGGIFEDGKTYIEKRAEAYPSTADQLDDIYHNGVDGWKATISSIKDKYPKPISIGKDRD